MRKLIATIAAATAILFGTVAPGNAAPAAPAHVTRAECLAAAEKASWSHHLAQVERRDALHLVKLANAAGDTKLAAVAEEAARGVRPLMIELWDRVALAGEDLDNGQYGKCARDLKPWM